MTQGAFLMPDNTSYYQDLSNQFIMFNALNLSEDLTHV